MLVNTSVACLFCIILSSKQLSADCCRAYVHTYTGPALYASRIHPLLGCDSLFSQLLKNCLGKLAPPPPLPAITSHPASARLVNRILCLPAFAQMSPRPRSSLTRPSPTADSLTATSVRLPACSQVGSVFEAFQDVMQEVNEEEEDEGQTRKGEKGACEEGSMGEAYGIGKTSSLFFQARGVGVGEERGELAFRARM